MARYLFDTNHLSTAIDDEAGIREREGGTPNSPAPHLITKARKYENTKGTLMPIATALVDRPFRLRVFVFVLS